MQQLAASLATHHEGHGYIPNEAQLNEISGV
jgi:hypothetical protein